jgi:hypothetical protein
MCISLELDIMTSHPNYETPTSIAHEHQPARVIHLPIQCTTIAKHLNKHLKLFHTYVKRRRISADIHNVGYKRTVIGSPGGVLLLPL